MSNEIYTNMYYLKQYIRITIVIQKLCCVMTLTNEELMALEAEFPRLKFERIKNHSNLPTNIYKIF